MSQHVDTFVKQNVYNYQDKREVSQEAAILEFECTIGFDQDFDDSIDVGGMVVYRDTHGDLAAWYDYENGKGFAPTTDVVW